MSKNYHKKLLGVLGLSAVAIMTAVASAIPAPAASAVSVSDTITVTVVDSTPKVVITNIVQDQVMDSYRFKVEYSYEHLESIDLYLNYETNRRGFVEEHVGHKEFDTTGLVAGASGTGAFNIDLSEYAASSRYTLYLAGTGVSGQAADMTRDIIYRPIVPTEGDISTEQDSKTGDPIINLDNTSSDVSYVTVTVADEDGAIVMVKDPATGEETEFTQRYDAPIDKLPVNFASAGVTKSGKYYFIIRAYTDRDKQIGAEFTVIYNFEAVHVPYTPNTGSFLGSLNLAREDYAVTGLIVFGGAILLVALFLKKKNRR